MLITNPPYGQRLKPADIEGLYELLGNKLKHVFKGYHAWVIGYDDEVMSHIGLAPSSRDSLLNGSLECELREYIIFEGARKKFIAGGGSTKSRRTDTARVRGPKQDLNSRPKGEPVNYDPWGDRPNPVEPENPLAKRRNPKALEAIIGRKPKISPRKGWRRKED